MLNVPSHQLQVDASAQCEVLFELSQGVGSAQLGRLLKGHDAGRLVSLRHIKAPSVSELSPKVDIARSIAHPSLAKLLGIVRAGDRVYLASEYIPGVILAELGRAVVSRRKPLALPVALRILVDALNASIVGQELLRMAAGEPAANHLHPEHIHIAAYGETLLSEVGVACYLQPEAWADGQNDLRTAATELCRLITASDDADGLLHSALVPESLQRTLERAMRPVAAGAPAVRAFVDELSHSGVPLASEEEVRDELFRLVGASLDARRGKLELLEREAAQQDSEDSTQFFRSAELLGTDCRDTARPPADALPSAVAIPRAGAPPSVAVAPSVKLQRPSAGLQVDDDEPTQLWREDAWPKSGAVPVLARELARVASTGLEPLATVSQQSTGEPSHGGVIRTPATAALEDTEIPRFRERHTAGWLLLAAVVLGGLALLADHLGY
jgi:hypothetical protein